MCYIAFTNVRCSVQDVVPKSEVNRLRIYDARHSPANRRIERGRGGGGGGSSCPLACIVCGAHTFFKTLQ